MDIIFFIFIDLNKVILIVIIKKIDICKKCGAERRSVFLSFLALAITTEATFSPDIGEQIPLKAKH